MSKWAVYRRMRLAVAGTLGIPYVQIREYYRSRRFPHLGDRPEYDEDRRQKNIAHASISRSLVRLVARGLVEWTVDENGENGERIPAVTEQGAAIAAQLRTGEVVAMLANLARGIFV
jgi:hypothetical protein